MNLPAATLIKELVTIYEQNDLAQIAEALFRSMTREARIEACKFLMILRDSENILSPQSASHEEVHEK